MAVFVQLNDVLNETIPSVLDKRIDYAFGYDGTDFWEKFFFLCDGIHTDDKIVYLFTEYQMETLWEWWNEKTTKSKDDIQINLDYSKQRLFNTLRVGDKFREVFACYIRYNPGYLHIIRTHFGEHPSNYLSKGGSGKTDFFNGKFRGEPPDSAKLDDDQYRQKLLDLLKTREKIANEFGGPVKNIKDWLRYLALKRDTVSTLPLGIVYCVDINQNCPLIKKI